MRSSLVISVIAAFAVTDEMYTQNADEDPEVTVIAAQAKEKHDSTSSLSQTLAILFSKDLWAGSLGEVHLLSAGKSAEHNLVI